MQKNNIIIAIIIVCIILVGLVFYATNMNTDSDNAIKDGNIIKTYEEGIFLGVGAGDITYQLRF